MLTWELRFQALQLNACSKEDTDEIFDPKMDALANQTLLQNSAWIRCVHRWYSLVPFLQSINECRDDSTFYRIQFLNLESETGNGCNLHTWKESQWTESRNKLTSHHGFLNSFLSSKKSHDTFYVFGQPMRVRAEHGSVFLISESMPHRRSASTFTVCAAFQILNIMVVFLLLITPYRGFTDGILEPDPADQLHLSNLRWRSGKHDFVKGKMDPRPRGMKCKFQVHNPVKNWFHRSSDRSHPSFRQLPMIKLSRESVGLSN